MRRFIPVLCAALLAGCAPAFNRPAFLATFVGQPEAEVIRRLGVPSRTIEANGRRFLAYSERRTEVIGGGPFFGGFGYYGPSFGYYGAFPAAVSARGCETAFEVAEGKVVTWSLRGHAC